MTNRLTEPELIEVLRGTIPTYGTKRALADAIGVSPQFLGDLLRVQGGKSQPSRNMSPKVARFLGFKEAAEVWERE